MQPRTTIAVFALTLWAACGGKVTTITIEDEAETEVEGGTLLESLVSDIGFDSFLDMNLVASDELANQGVEPGDIQEVYLTDFELEATAGDPDLSFLEAMDLYVEAPGLPRVLVASQDAFPKGEPLVVFDVEDVDLTDYVVSEAMTLTTDVTGHRPSNDTTVVGRYVIDIGVTLQGACNAAKGD